MKKSLLSGLLLTVLFISGSCNPFTANVYSSFDKYKNPDLTDPAALLDAANEPQFYEFLMNDPEAREQVIDTLQGILDDANATDLSKLVAALMISNTYLKTSDTSNIMDNLNSLAQDAISGDIPLSGVDGGPELVFRLAFGEPPDSLSKEEYKVVVLTQLNAFLSAAEPLQAYGEILEVTEDSPPGTNDRDNATKALLAGRTRTMAYYIDAPTTAESLNILAEYLATPRDADGGIPYKITYSPFSPIFGGLEDMLEDPADSENPKKNGLKKVVNFGGIDMDAFN
jgi:hypothetical protein